VRLFAPMLAANRDRSGLAAADLLRSIGSLLAFLYCERIGFAGWIFGAFPRDCQQKHGEYSDSLLRGTPRRIPVMCSLGPPLTVLPGRVRGAFCFHLHVRLHVYHTRYDLQVVCVIAWPAGRHSSRPTARIWGVGARGRLDGYRLHRVEYCTYRTVPSIYSEYSRDESITQP
jgi:hypothetical protein